MTLVLDCPSAQIPDWFARRYVAGDVSPGVMLIAMAHWAVKIALLPVDLTLDALLRVDTMLYELMSLGAKLLFLLWIWTGGAHPHQVILNKLSAESWTVILSILIISHILAIRRRDRDARAICLILDVSGYFWLLINILKGRYYFGEIFLWLFFAMGIVAVLSLRRSSQGEITDGKHSSAAD